MTTRKTTRDGYIRHRHRNRKSCANRETKYEVGEVDLCIFESRIGKVRKLEFIFVLKDNVPGIIEVTTSSGEYSYCTIYG